MTLKNRILLAAAALAVAATPSGAAVSPTRGADALGESLRQGGYVVYLRELGSACITAAQRGQAVALGRALSDFGVAVGRVVSAPECGSRSTARAAFGGGVRVTSTLASLPRRGRARTRRISALRRLLAARPATGTTFVVGHRANLAAATGVALQAGEAAVFRRRSGRAQLVTRVLPLEWEPTFVRPRQPPDAPFQEFRVPSGTHPHDVAPAPDGSVWYTEQFKGSLGRLDRAQMRLEHIPLGAGSAPHGVIVGPDGAPWITDQGLNAIVRVDPQTREVRRFPLPGTAPNAALNTAVFDRNGVLWFTGQAGYYGRLDPRTGELRVWNAPRGPGPYGITATPSGDVYYAALQSHYVGRIDIATGAVTVLDPPTPNQGSRRVWSDSRGRVWVAEWDAGQLGLYDPATGSWREWRLPGSSPQADAVFVDERDVVWVTDFGGDALVRFDPATEQLQVLPWPTGQALVRRLLGRPGEVWGAESATDKLVLYRSG